MHKSATKCNETIGKWCKNKHGASKIIDTFETYQSSAGRSQEARPVVERCVVYRTQEVEDAERALRWSLVAYVSGTQRVVSAESATAVILARFPELEGHFSVHRFWPAEFLFVFDLRARKDVVAGTSPVDGRSFALRFSP
jgi:hypothetical protein